MKRLLLLLLTCICIKIIMAQQPVLAIKQLSIAQGDVAQLEVSLENASANCTAFQFDLTLPAGISIKKDGEGQMMAKLNDDRVSDHRFHVSEILSNTYRFLAYSMNNANIAGSSGTLIEITLNAEADNSLGTVEGQINNGLLVTANNEITELVTNEFLITIVETEYTLAYKVDGEDYKTYKIKYGASITPEAAPTKEGYSFSGWDNVPETMPAKDVTVSGTFSINKYKLIYKVDGSDYKSYDVEYGATIIPEAAPTKEGYTFSGWSEIPETMPAKDVTVTGTFSIKKYKLIYKVDGTDYNSFDVEYGSSITPEAAPTKEGYTFSGWSEIPETMPAKDVTVTGTFSIKKYKLIYKVDGSDYKSLDVEYGSPITPEATPTKEGYTFSGWSEIPETMPAKDVIVTGSFKEITGIISVINDSPGVLIYDMQGRRIEHLQKGLNIIRMSDGKTKKVMGK